jgi:hypothetical protein
MNRLRDDPALIKAAVEELLRYNGPLETATERYTREDTTVTGVTVPRGELVLAVLASANRDEQQFEQADRLDLGREPNPHVAFGSGIHYCLGASLARLEGQVAIATLLGEFRTSRLPFHPTPYAGDGGSCYGVWRVYQSRLQEIPGEVRGEGREEVLSEVRCGRCRWKRDWRDPHRNSG